MRIVKIIFGLAIIALVIWLVITWISGKTAKKKLLSSFGVSIVEIYNSNPPRLLIEVENKGAKVIGMTHFRLRFYVVDKRICGVDQDAGNFKPNEKRRIFLKCQDTTELTSKKINFHLAVFHDDHGGFEPLIGEFTLKY